jgi:hydrogenase maturation protein HypF
MACAWLEEIGAPMPSELQHPAWDAVASMCRSGVGAPLTTSVGRLFDAVAALCGLRSEVTYEGQAAVELEAACDRAERGAYPMPGLDARETIAAVVGDVSAGVPVASIAMRFHRGLAVATADAVEATGIPLVVLSGGVFQNRVLLDLCVGELEARGLRVLVPQLLPPNDGGISFGQAAVAAVRAA